MILIAVGLFAALSYAVTSSSRSGTGDTSGEKAKLSQAVMDSYMAAINGGTMRLKMRGCETIDYTPPSGWGSENHKCHLFHPEGGQVAYQDLGLNNCDISGKTISDLNIGESCGSTIYAGIGGGNRIYAMNADSGSFSYNNGSGPAILVGVNSLSDGLSNTNTLVSTSNASSPYMAASACRSLGIKWYLPALDELQVLYDSRNIGDFAGTFTTSGSFRLYWSSTERNGVALDARSMAFDTGTSSAGHNKANSFKVRCVRRD